MRWAIVTVTAGAVFAMWAALFTEAYAQTYGEGGNYGMLESYTGGPATSITATGAASTADCVNDRVSYDNNGVWGCQWTSAGTPQDTVFRAQSSYPGGAASAGDLRFYGGQDETTAAIDGAGASCNAGDSVTATIVDENGVPTATALVFGTDWCVSACADAAAMCASLATALNALAGITASCSSPTVLVYLDTNTPRVLMAESDAACTTVGTGTTGNIFYHPRQFSVSRPSDLGAIFRSSTTDFAIELPLTPLRLLDNIVLQIGNDTSSNDFSIRYSTAQTPDAAVIGTSDDSNVIIITEDDDVGTDYAKSAQTNPTLCIASADQTTVTDRLCLAHDQTNAQITTDGGGLTINSAGTTTLSDNVTFNGTLIGTLTSTIGWAVIAGQSGETCESTCTAPCVAGFEDGAFGAQIAILDCSATLADSGQCICAGAN